MEKRYILGTTRPYYQLAREPDYNGVSIELSEEEYADYRAMMDAWVRWQKRLGDVYGT
jgi:hypothetical protein